MIGRLQFISQESSDATHLQSIQAACQAGVRWIQLRVKEKPLAEVRGLAEEAKSICREWGARLVINDYPQIAAAIGADGLHLGKEDLSLYQARQLVRNMYIGQTANTFEDVWRYSLKGADYIGLGPFAYTTTKKKLSPILGLEGYRQIMLRCSEEGITTPIIAIGGITLADIEPILQTGVHGIAVSSLICRAVNCRQTVAAIQEILEKNPTTYVNHCR